LAKQTIEAIRQAEIKAVEIEKKAIDESSAVIGQAEELAIKIIEEMTMVAKDQVNHTMMETQIQVDAIHEKALQEAEEKIDRLRMQAMEKETEAVSLILSEFI